LGLRPSPLGSLACIWPVSGFSSEVVLEWESPKSVFEIRSFLGLVGYYRRFIEGFSKLALPLTKLTQKGQAFVWDTQCGYSFQTLKGKIEDRSSASFS